MSEFPNQELIDAAMQLGNESFESSGTVAALRTDSGKILTSVFCDARVDSACLCAETGAICEAHKLNERVVTSVCLRREEDRSFTLLPACGVCQERLAYWGLSVEILVPGEEKGNFWQVKTLKELRPFYWNNSVR